LPVDPERGQDSIHRAFRAQVLLFVEQRGDDLCRRSIHEARGGEHVRDAIALGVA
jgi:hypothetical protein